MTPPDPNAPPPANDLDRAGAAIAGFGSFEWDLVSPEWLWSPQASHLFGYDPGKLRLTLTEWGRAIFPDDLIKLRAAIDSANRYGSYYAEFRVTRADKTVRWLAGRGQRETDSRGKPILRGAYYDITERKGLEARLLAVNEALEARVSEVREEAHMLEVLNRTGVALSAELSQQSLVQMVTDAAVELTGAKFGAFFYNLTNESGESYTLYTLSGAPRSAFEKFPLPRNTAIFDPTFRGDKPVRSDDILADPRYGKSEPFKGMPKGHLPVRSYLAVPVVSRSGEVLGGLFFGHPDIGVFTARDEQLALGIAGQAAIAIDNARLYEASQREIAARLQVQEELQRLNETLAERVAAETTQRQEAEEALRHAQKMEAIGQLTGGIAHDFNNLLTVIGGNIELLQQQMPKDERAQRLVGAALRGATRAAVLTQRLLAFARRQPLSPTVAELNRIVSGMSDLLQRTLGEEVAVETVLAAGLWPAFVDINQLESALINLAVNSRDAMPDGGKLTIETANCHLDDGYVAAYGDLQPGQYVGVFVTDTGIGMSGDTVAKAFEPFFTTKEVGQGTGLGLSQVYGFAKQSGGHAKIYSEVGQGTSVKLYFPRYEGEEAMARPGVVPSTLPRTKENETVLVVEDDSDVRSFTVMMMQNLGYRVVPAENGAAALRQLDANPEIVMIFTDVGLPGGMNGRQLVDEARRRRPKLKVLFTTGYARNAIVHQGRLDRDVKVVFKPFGYSDLAIKLRQVLDE